MPYKRRIQIIFQNPYASLNPRFTVGQILIEPMRIHGIGADAAERTRRWRFELLERVGLAGRGRSTSIRTSSRAASASASRSRAASRMKPDILICDESVSALDVSVQAQVLNLLQDLQDEYRADLHLHLARPRRRASTSPTR